ncbi:HipA domain-containing protein [Caenimonas sedimenti]|uniref:HipA domain-containing protein n=1 Tax=Caenimonas sedimenti TaxID=2596921 RepID=A0A562ZLX2_9BURK|nr:HipA domain-containing protein [Caenimonas sedimenti]TWO69493.1 HipA domain-containing protein [Caenimonas sedimenti]
MAQRVLVFADWQGLGSPRLLGTLHARAGSGREVFEFAFAAAALADRALTGVRLDPHLAAFAGPQHAHREAANFGAFSDASPDRWGRLLMRRRLERLQRTGAVARDYRLRESDYLLGVHDAFRAGALRFKLEETDPFLDNQHDVAAPPFVRLRELEAAAQALEDERGVPDASRIDAWLRMLVAPGGSLGGARPKASVADENGHLWIAKFPSVQDAHDVGAWELVVHALAQAAGIAVAPAWARKFGGGGHTFAVKRFDRTAGGERLHFASAMTLTGRRDGEGAATGASYLELARVLMEHGAQPAADLRQLWSRIVFNLLVSNTDDHLRNHGFLLIPGKGWRLAEAYDMNPVPDAGGLSLNISETDNARDLELARSVAGVFRVKPGEAEAIIARLRAVVVQWAVLAKRLGIAAREQDRMAGAFTLA